jgi:hypothetical protein
MIKSRRWEDNEFKEMVWERVEWIYVAHNTDW